VKWGLVIAMLGAAVARGTVFTEGGTVGAWGCSVVFFTCIATLMLLVLRDAVRAARRGHVADSVRWSLTAVAIIGIVAWAFLEDRTAQGVAAAIALAGVVGALGAYGGRSRQASAE
jgi:uncharacterized membrane protein